MNKIEEKVNECLNCKIKPCSKKGCPLENDIPEFIKEVKNNNIRKAYEIVSKTTVLPGICGRICPHQKQCKGSCIKGIKGKPVEIGDIEAYIFDKATQNGLSLKEIYKIKETKKQNKKVAIIGGGPAGLTCAAFLAKEGIEVTIYEKQPKLGGILTYGIPEFRLPKNIVEKTIKNILDLGIKVKYNKKLGKDFNLEQLKEKYDYIFISVGANKSSKMGVEGENLKGVYGGNELLEKENHPKYEGKKVAIIGGGNVAMDCARTINKKGAKETIVIYRRSEKEMPAEEKEIAEAKKEGVKFLFQNNIVKIIGKEKVEKAELIKTKLIKKEGEKREVPINIENSNYEIDVDYIIMALGGTVNDEVKNLNLEHNKWGNIKIDEQGKTTSEKIYAGGDVAGEKGTVAWAAKSGRKAAKSIIEKIKK